MASHIPAPPVPVAEQRFPEYRRERLLGRGACGEVWEVRGCKGERLALKRVDLSGMRPKDRRLALQEAQLLQRIAHPHIVRFVDSAVQGCVLCIAMQYLDGGDLHRTVSRARELRQRIKEADIWKWFLQVASALRHLHKMRVIHRDVKPANIFLTRGTGGAVLGDLGIAKVLVHQEACAATLVGTPAYLAPEVWLGHRYGYAADTYSLGCTVYELAELRVPFAAENHGTLAALACSHVCMPLSASAGYSRALRDIVQLMLSKDPCRRPGPAQVLEFAQRVEFGGRGPQVNHGTAGTAERPAQRPSRSSPRSSPRGHSECLLGRAPPRPAASPRTPGPGPRLPRDGARACVPPTSRGGQSSSGGCTPPCRKTSAASPARGLPRLPIGEPAPSGDHPAPTREIPEPRAEHQPSRELPPLGWSAALKSAPLLGGPSAAALVFGGGISGDGVQARVPTASAQERSGSPMPRQPSARLHSRAISTARAVAPDDPRTPGQVLASTPQGIESPSAGVDFNRQPATPFAEGPWLGPSEHAHEREKCSAPPRAPGPREVSSSPRMLPHARSADHLQSSDAAALETGALPSAGWGLIVPWRDRIDVSSFRDVLGDVGREVRPAGRAAVHDASSAPEQTGRSVPEGPPLAPAPAALPGASGPILDPEKAASVRQPTAGQGPPASATSIPDNLKLSLTESSDCLLSQPPSAFGSDGLDGELLSVASELGPQPVPKSDGMT